MKAILTVVPSVCLFLVAGLPATSPAESTTILRQALSTAVIGQGPTGQQDPKKIIEKIQKEMEEINRLLNQASRSSSSSSSSGSSSSSSSGSSSSKSSASREHLEKSLQKSDAVIEGIDTLLRMASQGGKSGSSKGKKPKGSEKKPGQGEPRKPDDREGQNPDFIKQGEKKGENKEKGGDPKNAKKDPKTGRNIKQKDQRKDATERHDKKAESGSWGNLPPYLQKLFRAGGKPEVPARYREFENEFHRNADKKVKKR